MVKEMRADVKRAIEKFQIKTFGNNKNIEKFEKVLNSDEEVLYLSPTNIIVSSVNTGKKETLPGVCALTNQRLVFQYKILFNTRIESVGLDKIDSVDSSSTGLKGGHVRIHTITKTYDILVSYKDKIVQEIQNIFENTIYRYKKYDDNSSTNIVETIKKLSELKESGVLSEKEFEQKKKELISKI